jgi:hypothetical protein
MHRGTEKETDMAKRTSPFYAEVGTTDAGSIRVTVRAKNPNDPKSGYRQLAVSVYKLAAEMERRSEKLGADWVVSAQVFNSRIDVEVVRDADTNRARQFVAKVLADLGLT